jgi:translation elongation factor EF-1alpha
MDEATVMWSKDRYNKIIKQLKPFLAQTGYDPELDCTFLPISGLEGENIDCLVEE